MRNFIPVVVFLCSALGCNLSNLRQQNSNLAYQTSPTPSDAPSPSSLPTAQAMPANPSIIAILKKSAGKYPADVKLLENAEMKARLKKLLGNDFPDMKEHWNVETPIKIEGDVLMASGCEQHNCGGNMYMMFVDLKRDNINVFHVNDDRTKHYYEHGEMALPKDFADEVATER